jgi:hypothetical protein
VSRTYAGRISPTAALDGLKSGASLLVIPGGMLGVLTSRDEGEWMTGSRALGPAF